MIEQINLFDDYKEPYIKSEINIIIDNVAKQTEYPVSVFTISENKKNIGRDNEKIVGYSLYLDKTLFAKINADGTKIQITKDLFQKQNPNGEIEVKEVKKPANCICITFSTPSNSIEYLKEITFIFASEYIPSERFGCCHLYMSCSDAKRCIASDKFHARGCFYRDNLEHGRIFYGKNAN